MNILKKIGFNLFITPKLITTSYWLMSVTSLALITTNDWPLIKKTIILVATLTLLRIITECLIVFFKLLENQQKTNQILESIHLKINSNNSE